MTTSIQEKLSRFTFPPTGATLAPEESINDLKLELLTVSRKYKNVPFNSIDIFVVYGLTVDKFISDIYNRLYTRINYQTDVLLDKILNHICGGGC